MEKTKLKIHIWPEKILKEKCKSVDVIDSEIKDFLSEMCRLMKENDGVGLAANQVGINKRLVVIGIDDVVFKLINPVILKKEGTICFSEGCLSFPEVTLEIKRAKKIWVSALNEKSETIELEVNDVLAVVFQHEIDHIDGITFVDRISFVERMKIMPQLKRLKKKQDGL